MAQYARWIAKSKLQIAKSSGGLARWYKNSLDRKMLFYINSVEDGTSLKNYNQKREIVFFWQHHFGDSVDDDPEGMRLCRG